MKKINKVFESKLEGLTSKLKKDFFIVAEKHLEGIVRDRWIALKDEKPKQKQHIVTINIDHGTMPFHPGKCFHWLGNKNGGKTNFTHWMPMPKKPKVETKTNEFKI